MPGSRALTSLVSATLVGAFAASAPASDVLGGFVDMRLGGGITGGANDLKVTDAAGAQQINQRSRDDFKSNYRITLDWVGSTGLRSYGGWLWGLGGSFMSHSGRPTQFNDTHDLTGGPDGTIKTEDASVMSWAIDGFIGYGVPVGEHLQFELLPFIGAGRSYLDIPQSGSTHSSLANDGSMEVGVNIDAVWTTSSGFQFGVTAGYLYWETSIMNQNYPVDNATLTNKQAERFSFRADTWSTTAFIGIRF